MASLDFSLGANIYFLQSILQTRVKLDMLRNVWVWLLNFDVEERCMKQTKTVALSLPHTYSDFVPWREPGPTVSWLQHQNLLIDMYRWSSHAQLCMCIWSLTFCWFLTDILLQGVGKYTTGTVLNSPKPQHKACPTGTMTESVCKLFLCCLLKIDKGARINYMHLHTPWVWPCMLISEALHPWCRSQEDARNLIFSFLQC